jgi:TM2 domain-containing membrane protein YozV
MERHVMTEMVLCHGCGREIHRTAPACPHCGALQHGKKGLKSKTTAAILAILIGGFGVHRFYLGQWWGVFYLLLVWTWIPGLISIVEGIVFICRDQEKWDEKYNQGISSSGQNSGGAILLVVLVFVGVMVVGILAAIAIPQYAEYQKRAHAKVFLQDGKSVYTKLKANAGNENEAIATVNALRNNAGDGSSPLSLGSQLNVGNDYQVSLSSTQTPLRGVVIEFTPEKLGDAGPVEWHCKIVQGETLGKADISWCN